MHSGSRKYGNLQHVGPFLAPTNFLFETFVVMCMVWTIAVLPAFWTNFGGLADFASDEWRPKIVCFCEDGFGPEKLTQMKPKTASFVEFLFVKVAQKPMFLATLLSKLQVIKVKKTLLFTTQFYASVEETLQKPVFSKLTSKNRSFGRFS